MNVRYCHVHYMLEPHDDYDPAERYTNERTYDGCPECERLNEEAATHHRENSYEL